MELPVEAGSLRDIARGIHNRISSRRTGHGSGTAPRIRAQYQGATAAQYQPSNVNIAIRISSPGNDGPVSQANVAVAAPRGPARGRGSCGLRSRRSRCRFRFGRRVGRGDTGHDIAPRARRAARAGLARRRHERAVDRADGRRGRRPAVRAPGASRHRRVPPRRSGSGSSRVFAGSPSRWAGASHRSARSRLGNAFRCRRRGLARRTGARRSRAPRRRAPRRSPRRAGGRRFPSAVPAQVPSGASFAPATGGSSSGGGIPVFLALPFLAAMLDLARRVTLDRVSLPSGHRSRVPEDPG